eukprot:3482741-Alexandrium_andersonii.AAC.1
MRTAKASGWKQFPCASYVSRSVNARDSMYAAIPVAAALSAVVGARRPICRPFKAIQSAARATTGSL